MNEILRNGMADSCVGVPVFRVREASRSVEVEQMSLALVLQGPEVPQVVVFEMQHGGRCRKWCQPLMPVDAMLAMKAFCRLR